MNVENTQSQMRKGILEYCILSILDKKEAYPSEILERLDLAQLKVVEGTIYPLLTRLKNMQLLDYRWAESTSGPPRKYYQITDKGKLFLAELLNTWEELTASVNQITKNNNPENAPQNSFDPNS
jgi:PadR family transcriptional regulator PadR